AASPCGGRPVPPELVPAGVAGQPKYRPYSTGRLPIRQQPESVAEESPASGTHPQFRRPDRFESAVPYRTVMADWNGADATPDRSSAGHIPPAETGASLGVAVTRPATMTGPLSVDGLQGEGSCD